MTSEKHDDTGILSDLETNWNEIKRKCPKKLKKLYNK
jgi:hypothetical protein